MTLGELKKAVDEMLRTGDLDTEICLLPGCRICDGSPLVDWAYGEDENDHIIYLIANN